MMETPEGLLCTRLKHKGVVVIKNDSTRSIAVPDRAALIVAHRFAVQAISGGLGFRFQQHKAAMRFERPLSPDWLRCASCFIMSFGQLSTAGGPTWVFCTGWGLEGGAVISTTPQEVLRWRGPHSNRSFKRGRKCSKTGY